MLDYHRPTADQKFFVTSHRVRSPFGGFFHYELMAYEPFNGHKGWMVDSRGHWGRIGTRPAPALDEMRANYKHEFYPIITQYRAEEEAAAYGYIFHEYPELEDLDPNKWRIQQSNGVVYVFPV